MSSYCPSRFIRKTLMPNEHCVADARLSSVYTMQAWGFLLSFSFLGFALHFGLLYFQHEFVLLPLWVGLGIGLFFFFSLMVKKWTTEIILTNERLIYKQGFFSIDIKEVDIEQLASDNVSQSFFGRLFDYGEIYIRCIEAKDISLPSLRHPYDFRNALEERKHQYRDEYMKVERLRRRSGKETGWQE